MTTDNNSSPVTAPMWWDGGDRAITAREKATIEEHGPSCYTVPLVPAQAVDPTDPWRGLYLPARMPAPSEYGDLAHPDTPLWPDDREDALDKLVHAQGFDFHIVAGDFTEEAMEDGDELYWQELRAWNPEAPEGEWRLAWKGDTEDGPYAWFVRPMALRPEPVALAACQPVGSSPEWFELVIRDVCELDPEDPDAADTVCIRPLDLRLIMERHAAPPAQGIDLHRLVPPEWISEQIGGPIDDLTPGQAWRQGFNQCRTRALLLVEQAMGFPAEQQRDAAPGVGNG